MAIATICVILKPKKIKCVNVFLVSLSLYHEVVELDAMILFFWVLSFKPTFWLLSFTFIKRLFSSFSLSAIRMVSSAYLRLLIFLLAVLIPAVLHPALYFAWCTLQISLISRVTIYSPTYSFPDLEPVHCSTSHSNCCFLTCIQISQESGKVVWCSHLFKNFPEFVVIYIVKCFGMINKAEIDGFSGNILLFLSFNRRLKFDLWFFCLF